MNSEIPQPEAAPEAIPLNEAGKEAPAPEAAQQPHEVSINFDGANFVCKIPAAIGKMGVYGAIALLHEEAQKVFFAMERRAAAERKAAQDVMNKLHIPGRPH